MRDARSDVAWRRSVGLATVSDELLGDMLDVSLLPLYQPGRVEMGGSHFRTTESEGCEQRPYTSAMHVSLREGRLSLAVSRSN